MNYDIIFITETWLDETIPDSLLTQTLKYNCIRRDRNNHGGGICILFKQNIDIRVKKIPNEFQSSEMLVCDIIGSGLNYRIILSYRPPNTDIEQNEELCRIIRWATVDISYTVLALGDFNFPRINWSSDEIPSETMQSLFSETVNIIHVTARPEADGFFQI